MQERLTVVYLTRVRLPAFAPQSVQVLATAHALAVAGAHVYLFADLPLPGVRGGTATRHVFSTERWEAGRSNKPDPVRVSHRLEGASREVLANHGLSPHPRLHLSWLPASHPVLAGLAYRRDLVAALLEARKQRSRVILLSRRVDYASDFLRVRAMFFQETRLIHEWHYVDSANALEAGRRREALRKARFEQRVLMGADGHIAISSRLATYLARRSPVAPIRVVPNGGPTPMRRAAAVSGREKEERWPTRQGRVVYAGLFRRPEDLRVLLDAVRALPSSVDVIVVGGDDGNRRLNAVMDMARQEGIPWVSCAGGLPESSRLPVARKGGGRHHATLCFAGPMTVRESRQVLVGADVAVAAFQDSVNMRWFACPLKISEYHAAGVPVVSTDHPTVRELVEDRRTGLLVPPGDGAAMARAILTLLSNPEQARGMAEAGLERAEHATWLRRGEDLFAWFRDLSTRPPG